MASPSDGEPDSAYRICAHVVQFLSHFVFAPHIEIVETPLPKKLLLLLGSRKLLWLLRRKIFLKYSRDLFFENLQNARGVAHSGFADEQMYMLRHDDEAQEQEILFRRTWSRILTKQSRARALQGAATAYNN
jgi:hypothetical protein